MKMVSLRRPKKTKAELEKMETVSMQQEERFPWGSRIELEKEEISKLPILQDIKADQKVTIMAEGFVKTVEVVDKSEQSRGRSRKRVEIQIERIGIEKKMSKKPQDMNNEEYREYRQSK